MKLERAKEKIITDFNSKGWLLLERVVKAFEDRKIEVESIEGISTYRNHEDGERTVDVSTIYRHNGSNENVSVRVSVDEWYTYIWQGDESKRAKRVYDIKVPKDASERVIKNRIEKVIENLKAE